MSREVIVKVLSEEEILQREEEAELLNDLLDNKYSHTKVVVSPYENIGELIRCKDCKWWSKEKDSLQGRCALLQMYPTGKWYCANAERKENA